MGRNRMSCGGLKLECPQYPHLSLVNWSYRLGHFRLSRILAFIPSTLFFSRHCGRKKTVHEVNLTYRIYYQDEAQQNDAIPYARACR